jgi:hypothetical protein
MPRPLYPGDRDLVPIVQEAGWAPGSVWTGAENLAPTWIRSPDRPDRRFAIPTTLSQRTVVHRTYDYFIILTVPKL